MAAFDIESLSGQVKTNCNISDAKFWGMYSICGLLMRLRGLFRQEMNITPWEEIVQGEMSAWLSSRENLWREIEGSDFVDLSIRGKDFPPFDIEGINKVLQGDGIIYGAGLGINMKPSFFLAELLSRSTVEGYEVSIAGDEFTRDLSVYPAMLQGAAIIARREALATLLWDKFAEATVKRHGSSLSYAFSRYGIVPGSIMTEALYNGIRKVAESEIEVYIRHEIGEAYEAERLGRRWKEVLAGQLGRRVEMFVRSIKDVLSDTSEKGMLKYVIDNDRRGSLGFYLSFMGGFRTLIFPEVLNAFEDFAVNGDWQVMERARKTGYDKAWGLASRVLEIHSLKGAIKASETIEKELVESVSKRR